MPGGTPKKTAQVEESRLRPRKRPGHSKVSGEATGTRPRFLEASHWRMLASCLVGTSETSTSSRCATHALSDVSLRSFTETNATSFHRSPSASYCAVHPPSTSNVDPVTKLEAREARNTAGPTISHTSPNRPRGTPLTT